MLRVLAVALLMATSLAGEAVPVCTAVTADDARTILGPAAKRTNDPSGCGWQGGNHKEMSLMRVGVASMFERARTYSAGKGTTQPESDLGGTAFSTIPAAQEGRRAEIYLLRGPAILIVKIDGFEPGSAVRHLPQVRDLVRKLAVKL